PPLAEGLEAAKLRTRARRPHHRSGGRTGSADHAPAGVRGRHLRRPVLGRQCLRRPATGTGACRRHYRRDHLRPRRSLPVDRSLRLNAQATVALGLVTALDITSARPSHAYAILDDATVTAAS